MGTAGKAIRQVRGRTDLALHRVGLRSSGGLVLPRFLGIGAQKAGSTWLHENLASHPQLFLPPEKELHHFDWFRQGDLAGYARNFASAGPRLPGEVTPGYSALRGRRVRMLGELLPGVRVLLLLRDPVERAWSQLRMDLRQAGRDVAELDERAMLRHLARRGATRRGSYPEMLAAWEPVFGERLWIGFFDDITDRPQELLTEVFVHLGVDPHPDWAAFPYGRAFNAGGPSRIPPHLRPAIVARYQPEIDELRVRFGERVARWGAH